MEVWNKKDTDISVRWRNGGKRECREMKPRNVSKGTRRVYRAQVCPRHHGVVVVFLLSASDDVAIGTKLLATLSLILGSIASVL